MSNEFNFSSTDSIVNQVILTNTCIHCRENNEITLNGNDLAKWRNGGLIQNAFPTLTDEQRELIQTGTHPKCWDDMFLQEDEDD
jgi:hypothetical protein